MVRPQRLATCFGLAVVLALAASPARAQSVAWIPIGSMADRALRHAVDAGALPTLDPLTRPWRMAAVRDAISRADTTRLSPTAVRALRWSVETVDALADTITVTAEAGLAAYRDGGTEPIRAAGASGVSPAFGVRVQAGGHRWVAVLNPAIDERWRDDPTYTGYRGGPVTGRMVEAYVALTGKVGDLELGRMARNWGPASVDGLQLSAIASPGDQLSGALRLGRFELTSIAQRIDNRDTLAAVAYHRFFMAHRLTVRLGAGSWLALTETGVYGGPGESFDLAMHAPLNLALLSEINEGQNLNSLLGAEAAIRLPAHARLELAGFLDDIQVDDSSLSDQRPTSYGFSAGVVVPHPSLPVTLDLRYWRVSSLAYRNSFDPQLIYAVRDIGIGLNAADFDQARLRISWKPAARADLFAEVMTLRQGSYDFRQPFPSDSVLAQPGQGFLVAPVQHAALGRVSGIAEWSNGLQVQAALGTVRTLAGATEGVATLSVRWRFDVLHLRPGGGLPALAPVP